MVRDRLAYASYFISFLLDNFRNLNDLDRAILFGSVARGEDSDESDVDIFLDIKKSSKKFESEVDKLVEKFYKSREAVLFKNKGVDNKINVKCGKLEEWGKLKDSIEGHGIVLYGKYVPLGAIGRKFIVFYWDGIGKNRGAFLNKLYGFKVKGKRYKGFIEILGGKKLGKSTIMVPVDKKDEIFVLIKKYKVNAKMFEIWT